MERVYAAASLEEAYAIRGRLWAAGIHAMIRGRDLSAMRFMQMTHDVQLAVWVDDADGEQAHRLLGDQPGR